MRSFFLTIITLISAGPLVCAQNEAEALLQNRMRTPLLQSQDTLTGEGQCWHAAYNMDRFMDGFRRTQDPAFLEAAVSYYDALIEKMHTSPDGYKGWVGPYIYDENYICDVHIGDAILINPMLDFSETVLKHETPEIVKKYEAKARGYLQLAKTHLIEKWHRRGTWHEDGIYGAYASWDHYMTEENLEEWCQLPAGKSNLTLPFNKQNSMAVASLRIYRITGEQPYRERALKIFNYLKSRMSLFQDHYVWNYWEPFGPWDIKSASSNQLRHWVNVHPYRNYQAGEVAEIVEAYHSGLTFSKSDIQRIINTNLKVMWNGDKENPQWNNSNHAVQRAALGEILIQEPPGGEFDKLAGTLWTALADFSKTIRELSGKAYDTPVGFERNYADLPVTVMERPFNSNKSFTMAAALPSHISRGESTYLVSQTRASGRLNIALHSSDGTSQIAEIRSRQDQAKNDNAGVHIVEWQTKNLAAGQYRVRWILNNEYREFPITVE